MLSTSSSSSSRSDSGGVQQKGSACSDRRSSKRPASSSSQVGELRNPVLTGAGGVSLGTSVVGAVDDRLSSPTSVALTGSASPQENELSITRRPTEEGSSDHYPCCLLRNESSHCSRGNNPSYSATAVSNSTSAAPLSSSSNSTPKVSLSEQLLWASNALQASRLAAVAEPSPASQPRPSQLQQHPDPLFGTLFNEELAPSNTPHTMALWSIPSSENTAVLKTASVLSTPPHSGGCSNAAGPPRRPKPRPPSLFAAPPPTSTGAAAATASIQTAAPSIHCRRSAPCPPDPRLVGPLGLQAASPLGITGDGERFSSNGGDDTAPHVGCDISAALTPQRDNNNRVPSVSHCTGNRHTVPPLLSGSRGNQAAGHGLPESPSGTFNTSLCSLGSAASAGAAHYCGMHSPKGKKSQFSVRGTPLRGPSGRRVGGAANFGGCRTFAEVGSSALLSPPTGRQPSVCSTSAQPSSGPPAATVRSEGLCEASTGKDAPRQIEGETAEAWAPLIALSKRPRRTAPPFAVRATGTVMGSPAGEPFRSGRGSLRPLSTDKPRRRCKGPLVRLSRDQHTLVAGMFRVSSEGCLTVRNFLLLNPTRIDVAPQLPPPPSTSLRGRATDSPALPLLQPCQSSIPLAMIPSEATAAPGETESVFNVPYGSIATQGSVTGDCMNESGGGGARDRLLTVEGRPHHHPRQSNSSSAYGNSACHAPIQCTTSSFALLSASMNTPYSPITYSMDGIAFPTTSTSPFPATVAQPTTVAANPPDSSSVGRLLRAGCEETSQPPSQSATPTTSAYQARAQSAEGPAMLLAASTASRGQGGVFTSNHPSTIVAQQHPMMELDRGGHLLSPPHQPHFTTPNMPAGMLSPVINVRGRGHSFHADPTASSLLLPYVDIPRTHIEADGGAPHLPSNAVRYVDLEVKAPVGHGASASVCVAIHLPTGRRLAVKRIDLSPLCLRTRQHQTGSNTFMHYSTGNGRVKQLEHIVIRELQVLHLAYRSPFMVKVYNAFFSLDNTTLDVVMEFMHYGSLDHVAECLQHYVREQQQERYQLTWRRPLMDNLSMLSSPAAAQPRGVGVVAAARTPTTGSVRNSPLYEAQDFPYYASLDATRQAMCSARTSTLSNVGTEEEVMDGESGYAEEVSGVSERVVAVVGEQLLRGVRDMHERGFIHRDIKPGNVLINEHGVVKLSDFGLSQRCDESGTGVESVDWAMKPPSSAAPTCHSTPLLSPKPSTFAALVLDAATPLLPIAVSGDGEAISTSAAAAAGMDVLDAASSGSDHGSGGEGDAGSDVDSEVSLLCSGTDKYMSPERQRGELHGKSSDVWAVGVTLAEFAVGEYPYDLTDCVDDFDRGQRTGHPLDLTRFNTHRATPLSLVLQDFLRLATLPVASQRPTARELLEHPFFRQWSQPFTLKDYLSPRIPVPFVVNREDYLTRR